MTGVLQGVTLGSLLFFIYIKSVPGNFASVIEVCAGGTLKFYTGFDMSSSVALVNNDVNKVMWGALRHVFLK